MKNDFLCPNYIILSEDKTSNVCWINPYPKRDLSATVIDTVAQRRLYASFWHSIGRNNYFRVIMATYIKYGSFLDLERHQARDLIHSLFLFGVSQSVIQECKISATW